MLLVFATRYDDVTERTFRIARHLLQLPLEGALRTGLLEVDATADGLAAKARDSVSVLAFYAHGDGEGRVLAQNGQPCWDDDRIPVLAGAAIVAHACRAMTWLASYAEHLRTRTIFGYREYLMTPCDGTDRFWHHYTEIHSLLPALLVIGTAPSEAHRRFYDSCTSAFIDLNRCRASLIELIAVQQSRDKIERLP
jgi:hypothetical protein